MTPTIRDLIQRLGISGRGAARLAGVAETTMRHYVQGDRRDDPAVWRVLHLAATVPAARAELERLAERG